MLEVCNIAFSYGAKEVLKDVTFAAKPGEIVCIVGNNGVGKTTLLKILAPLGLKLLITPVDYMSRERL